MRLEERALLAWPVLCYAALHRQTMEYTTLSKLTGMGISGMGGMLEFIHAYCLSERLPALSVLVVQKNTGNPGVGFTAAEDILAETAKVFAHPWLTTVVPTTDDLKAATGTPPKEVGSKLDRILDYVHANPGQTAAEIASALYPQAARQQQVNSPLNQLISKGLVRRTKEGAAFRYWSGEVASA